jgi:hypothetical protein
LQEIFKFVFHFGYFLCRSAGHYLALNSSTLM